MDRTDATRVLEVRRILIEGHNRILDGGTVPDVAMCKQNEVAAVFNKAILELETILADSGQVSFDKR